MPEPSPFELFSSSQKKKKPQKEGFRCSTAPFQETAASPSKNLGNLPTEALLQSLNKMRQQQTDLAYQLKLLEEQIAVVGPVSAAKLGTTAEALNKMNQERKQLYENMIKQLPVPTEINPKPLSAKKRRCKTIGSRKRWTSMP